jgi:methylenetetrahydrofolate dehydrogenase (NADP+)/methenyltetrahydrofolate cyclohydrolase
MAEILKGAPAAAALTEKLILRAAALREKGVVPTLAILRVGEREDDISYETGAMKRCAKVGIEVKRFLLPAGATKEQILDAVREINEDDAIHGCLMFRPLPDKDAEAAACALLAPEKDVDGMTTGSLAAVFAGKGAGFAPCTAQAVIELLDHYGVDPAGKRAVVVGRSLVIGKPVSMLLQKKNATVTMCHTKTADLPGECRRAEILVVAAGKAGVVTKDFVSAGQTVIDVGIHVGEDGKLCGDVKFDEAEAVVSAITPVPGGVGSVTTAVLASHVIEAAERRAP